MQENLLVFRKLLAFHDPELAAHLYKIQFQPDLYAISWFLTLFAHMLPLDRLYILWDTLLTGPAELTLFVGIAIMKEMRSTLLPLDFNNCILFFSHLPDFDISEVVREANRCYEITPKSLTVILPHKDNADDNRWWEKKMILDQLQTEYSPRIIMEDLINIKGKVTVLDIRRPEEYGPAHYIGSINLNHRDPSMSQLESLRGNIIIIIANKGRSGPEFANKLVNSCFPYVCVLHGGIDILRKDGRSYLRQSVKKISDSTDA